MPQHCMAVTVSVAKHTGEEGNYLTAHALSFLSSSTHFLSLWRSLQFVFLFQVLIIGSLITGLLLLPVFYYLSLVRWVDIGPRMSLRAGYWPISLSKRELITGWNFNRTCQILEANLKGALSPKEPAGFINRYLEL